MSESEWEMQREIKRDEEVKKETFLLYGQQR